MAKKKTRRKISTRTSGAKKLLARIAKCGYCGKTRPVFCVIFPDEYDEAEVEGVDQCEACVCVFVNRMLRSNRVVIRAKERQGPKMTEEKSVKLYERCAESEEFLSRWEVKLGLREVE